MTTESSSGGETNDEADAAARANSSAAEVIAGLRDPHLAVSVVFDEDHTLRPDPLVLDQSPSASKSRGAASIDR